MSIYFYGCMTLDGYLADKNHNLDWLHESGSVEETEYESFYNNIDITIMGKKTFDEVSKSKDPGQFFPSTVNYVFTHNKKLEVKGFHFIDEQIVSFVKNLDKDKNIWVVGGNTILSPLLDHDMIDVLIVQIAPVLLGDGIPLFTQNEATKRFYLKDVKKYGQFAEMVYTRKSD